MMGIRTHLPLSAYTAELAALSQTYLDLRLPLPAALRSAQADLEHFAGGAGRVTLPALTNRPARRFFGDNGVSPP